MVVQIDAIGKDKMVKESELERLMNEKVSVEKQMEMFYKVYETKENIMEEMKKEAKSMKLSTEGHHKKKKNDWPLEEHELKALEDRRARALHEIEHKSRKLGLVEDDNSKTDEGNEHEKKEDNITRVVNGRDDSEKAFFKELFYHSTFHGTLADIFLQDTDLISDSRGMVAFVATIKEQKLESKMCSSLRGRMLKVSLKKARGTSYPKSIWNVKEIGNILV
ncbi:BnaC03g64230D [Brassica napus]|uniref:(rape) hypothetical protein n=1 Tax=Brassica napus TaxID=3708 RepID=A0A078IB96_BRANA|nr:unnamed protein product [Brassica napus]CDY47101.1 BnaC03g64230D [Brassica napus]